ncbi:hypothetical protein TNCV_225631 [Trichonephila clavipes]|nr:hypothetical protein TNCV_225631 [Trichonephila clavipes]
MFPITGTNQPRPNHEKHHYASTTQLNSRHNAVTKETLAGHSPNPSDCQTVKRDSPLQRTVFHMSKDGELYTIAIDDSHFVE